MELIGLIKSNARLAFGVACLALALILLLAWGLIRLRQTLRKRKRPDLRQQGGGDAYHGEHSNLRRTAPLTERESHYTGGRHRRQGRTPLPYSDIPSYRHGRVGGRAARPISFWNPAYTGRRGDVWNHPQVRAVTLALLAVILAAVYAVTRYLLPDLATPAWAAGGLFWLAAAVILLPVLWGKAVFSLIALAGYLAGLALGELLGDGLSPATGAPGGGIVLTAVFLLACALGAVVQRRLSSER
ncbi:MAG: hypothetical protein LUC30_04160 [Clostridiales bacterium]|nr:hypothetical protein [Clostridiales bacterium]